LFENIDELLNELKNQFKKSILFEETNKLVLVIPVTVKIVQEIVIEIKEKEKSTDQIINELNEYIDKIEKENKELKKEKEKLEKVKNELKEEKEKLLKEKYENFKLENKNEFKSLNEYDNVLDFLLLKDGRLLVSLGNGIIKIYNSETFKEISSQQILEDCDNSIPHIHLMKNGNILPTIWNDKYNIYILKINNDNNFEIIKELRGHTNYISQVIELENEI